MNIANNYDKVDGFSDLVRDKSNNAIINNDIDAFQQFRRQRLEEQHNKEKLKELESKMETMQSILEQILAKLS